MKEEVLIEADFFIGGTYDALDDGSGSGGGSCG